MDEAHARTMRSMTPGVSLATSITTATSWLSVSRMITCLSASTAASVSWSPATHPWRTENCDDTSVHTSCTRAVSTVRVTSSDRESESGPGGLNTGGGNAPAFKQRT
jgi:hypothetical protein